MPSWEKTYKTFTEGELLGGPYGGMPEGAGRRVRPQATLTPTEEERKKESVGRKSLSLWRHSKKVLGKPRDFQKRACCGIPVSCSHIRTT